MGEVNIMPSYELKRQILGEILPIDTPFTVIVDVSEKCNFRCNYCFRSQPRNEQVYGYTIKNNLMSMDTYSKVLAQIKEFHVPLKRIAFSNHGEPLCNRNLPQMIRMLKQQGIEGKTEIHTNASLLDEVYAVELAEAGIDKIVVSIQGITAEKYENICGIKLDFEKFYNNLKILYEHKSNTQIYIKTVDVALDNGEEEVFLEQFGNICDRIYVEKVIPLFKGVDYKTFDRTDNSNNKYGVDFGNIKCCPQVFYTLTVAPDGTIYPCAQPIAPFELGNVNETTLQSAWNSKERKKFLLKMLEAGRYSMSKCKDCYVPQNTVKVKEDLLDPYIGEIIKRME